MVFYTIAPLGIKSPLLIYSHTRALSKGTLVRIPLRNKLYYGVVCARTLKPDFACKEIVGICGIFGDKQRLLADFIAYYYRSSLQESYHLFVAFARQYCGTSLMPNPSISSIHTESNSAQNTANKLSLATPLCFMSEPNLVPLSQKQLAQITAKLKSLSRAQRDAYTFLESKNIGLLFGDTGSGKTEIYFHLIAKSLFCARSALFLMPEIALTPQILARLKEVFGECVALWHSKLSTKQKQEVLQGLQTQRIKIIAGARSALFLPLANLGIIIVDEEHDDAYKSKSNPRHNARDMALFLASRARVRVVLGSATPSLGSYMLAQKGRYLFRLRGRYFHSLRQFVIEETKTSLTPMLLSHLEAVLDSSKQAIIFVPTRANFKALLCLECGYGFACPFCSVSMSLHLTRNALCCHYCGYTQALPKTCPQCGNDALSSKRIGTVQVATELAEAFPKARIGIFDKDHITTNKKLHTLLEAFKNMEIDILVGTQMLSKGHDYHNVSLAVVLGIDYLLNGGDFRSFERSMALLHQIAGRAGRKNEGKVFIQSLHGDWIRDFLADYEDFLRWELAHRSKVYPPFARLAIIHCTNRDKNKALESMHTILRSIEHCATQKNLHIIGYGESAIEKIANKWRYHILLSAAKNSTILKALENLGDLDIDIDCIDTL